MRYLIILIYFFSTVSFVSAQGFYLSGKITGSGNNLPVENVDISLSEKKFAASNSEGKFTFSNIPAGDYQLKFTHINFRTENILISVSGDTTISVQLSPKSILLDEVKITSGKYEQNINDVPYSASLVPLSEIERNPSATVAELLKNEPGISLIRDGSWGTEVSIRGMNRSNIVALVDGNRIETANDLSARLSMINLADIERIEVIKGSASSLYGSGATGGIINIISRSGNFEDKFYFKGNLNTGYNSVNRNISNGLSLFSGGNIWHAKISGSYRKAENTSTPSGELENSQFEDYSFAASGAVKTFTNQELKIDFQQFKAVDVGIPGAYGVFPDNASVSYPVELRKMISAEYLINDISSSFHKLSFRYFHQFILRKVENIPGIVQTVPGTGGQPTRRVSVLSINPGADHTTDGFQTQADFSFGNHYLITGIDLWRRKYTGERTKNQKIEILNPATGVLINTIYKTVYEKPLPDASFGNAGFYIQNETSLVKQKLSITLGGRFDLINIKNTKTLNPLYETNNGVPNYSPANQAVLWDAMEADNNSYVYNLGVLYSPLDYMTFTLNASRSFRSPSLEERYQYIDLGKVVRLGNANLRPEKGNFFDAGIRINTRQVKVNGSIFMNFMNDLVSEVPGKYESIDGPKNALLKTNIGEALLYGFDVDFTVCPVNNFTLYGNTSFVRGKDTKNKTNLSQIPPLNGLIGIRSDLIEEAEINFSAVLVTKQWEIAEGEILTPGYTYFNLFLNSQSYNFGLVNFSVSAGVENIFNKEYVDHLSTSRGIIKSEPGRNLFVKLNLNW
ncbi:MAG: TonB-dependent receptor [Oscillospiraceae bacterium]